MVESKKYLTFAPSKTSGSSSVGRASAFQAECREFEPRLPLFHTYFCGSSSVGRASAFQAECREFEPRLPLFHTYFCGSSSVGRASAFQAECREFEPRLPLCKEILDDNIKDFLLYKNCKTYSRHELQALLL